MQDILIAVVDGLKGFPEAINTVFPATTVQTCIVHPIRNSMEFARRKDRKQVADALKEVYRAPPTDAAALALETFKAGPSVQEYPPIAAFQLRKKKSAPLEPISTGRPPRSEFTLTLP